MRRATTAHGCPNQTTKLLFPAQVAQLAPIIVATSPVATPIPSPNISPPSLLSPSRAQAVAEEAERLGSKREDEEKKRQWETMFSTPRRSRKITDPNLSRPVLIFGMPGLQPGQFSCPWGVAFDKKNKRIIVTDSKNHRVQLFDRQGKFVLLFGGAGEENGKFNQPEGVCVLPETNQIVVVDNNNHRVQAFSEDGKYMFTLGQGRMGSSAGQLRFPIGVNVNSQGNIMVADSGNHRIQIFDKNGHFIKTFGSQGQGEDQFNIPSDLCIDAEGRILVSDYGNHRVCVWATDGSKCLRIIDAVSLQLGENERMFEYPRGICIHPSGHHIVACGPPSSMVFIIDASTGNLIRMLSSKNNKKGQIMTPHGVCLDEDGRLVVADYRNHQIQVFMVA